jgi:hypothetical protein
MKFDCLVLDLHPNNNEYELAGFFGKRDSLKAQFGVNEVKLRIMWLKYEETSLIFVSMDTLYFPDVVAKYIYGYFKNNFGINENAIICNATHTHSSPNLTLPNFGEINSDYLDSILLTIKENLPQLGQHFKPAKLCYKKIYNNNDNIIGRRRFVWDVFSAFLKRNTLLLPNKEQKIDDHLRLLTLVGENEEIEAVLYNFSCHPVFANNQLISSDFPGVINQVLSSKNISFSMFLQGFCGDIRPNITTHSIKSNSLKQNIKSLLYGYVFRKTTPKDLEQFSNKMASLIFDNLLDGVEVKDKFICHSFSHIFKSETKEVCKEYRVKLCMFKDIMTVSIPAEVLSTYYIFLSEKLPDVNFLPLGYSDGMLGYLPMSGQISEKGYEVTSAINYGWDTHLDTRNLECFANALLVNITHLMREAKQDHA